MYLNFYSLQNSLMWPFIKLLIIVFLETVLAMYILIIIVIFNYYFSYLFGLLVIFLIFTN